MKRVVIDASERELKPFVLHKFVIIKPYLHTYRGCLCIGTSV